MTDAIRGFRFLVNLIVFASSIVVFAGCHLFRPPYSPLPPLSPQPETLGAILPHLEQRWPQVSSYQAQGEMALSGEGVRGTLAFRSNTLYESPASIRVRASRGPKTVLEVLQTGSVVSIVDSTQGRVYTGPVEQLVNHPGVIGGIEPLEIARALLIGQTFNQAVSANRAAGEKPEALAFEGERLVLSQTFSTGGSATPNRFEEYVLRRRDGLIEGARLVQMQSNGRAFEIVVDYTRWGVTADGRPYPSELVIHSQNPRTRLKVKVDEAAFNPAFTPQVFWIDPQDYKMLPLEQFLEPPTGD